MKAHVTIKGYEEDVILNKVLKAGDKFNCPTCQMEHTVQVIPEASETSFSCRTLQRPMGCGSRTTIVFNDEEE